MSSRVWLHFASDAQLVLLTRRGDPRAFEILYDRHAQELMGFCRYMLGSSHDAEDAVQSTFTSAYKALLSDERSIAVRPWLFTIARNACVSMLRRRRASADVDHEPATNEGPVIEVERREDLRHLLESLAALPEHQRFALVLAELHGFKHTEIGELLGVPGTRVKSLVYQARSSLISDREAHEIDCREIREHVVTARGPALLRRHLRRHLRLCVGCREYAEQFSGQRRRRLGILFPAAPPLMLKLRALEATGSGALSGSAAVSGGAGATQLSGGGAGALIAKLLVGAVCVAAGTSIVTLLPGTRGTARSHAGRSHAGSNVKAGARAHILFTSDRTAARGVQTTHDARWSQTTATSAVVSARAAPPPTAAPRGKQLQSSSGRRPPGSRGAEAGNVQNQAEPGNPTDRQYGSGWPNAGHGGTLPGLGGRSPGHGGTPPGLGGSSPGHGGTPPGLGGSNPGHGGTRPGRSGGNPGHGGTPPGLSGGNPGHGGTPPGRSGSNPRHGDINPGHIGRVSNDRRGVIPALTDVLRDSA